MARSVRSLSEKVAPNKESSPKSRTAIEDTVCGTEPLHQASSVFVDAKEDEELGGSADGEPSKVKRSALTLVL